MAMPRLAPSREPHALACWRCIAQAYPSSTGSRRRRSSFEKDLRKTARAAAAASGLARERARGRQAMPRASTRESRRDGGAQGSGWSGQAGRTPRQRCARRGTPRAECNIVELQSRSRRTVPSSVLLGQWSKHADTAYRRPELAWQPEVKHPNGSHYFTFHTVVDATE
jgi:hypothetical protein